MERKMYSIYFLLMFKSFNVGDLLAAYVSGILH